MSRSVAPTPKKYKIVFIFSRLIAFAGMGLIAAAVLGKVHPGAGVLGGLLILAAIIAAQSNRFLYWWLHR